MLNEAQKKAVEFCDGPLYVSAGPGSGKTRVIIYRIHHLITKMNVDPYRIIAITFTKKAANEMLERLSELIPNDVFKLTISTFHSISNSILKKYWKIFKLWKVCNFYSDEMFNIIDQNEQKIIIKNIIKNINTLLKPVDILKFISKQKNNRLYSRNISNSTNNEFNFKLDIFRQYDKYLQTNNYLDFDDLLLIMRIIPEELKLKISQLYSYVLVDEFQDTNSLQYDILQILLQTHNNITIVGDTDQCIYSWRNANIKNLDTFFNNFNNVSVIELNYNYRSNQKILDACSCIVDRNLYSNNNDKYQYNSTNVNICSFQNENEEINHILSLINKYHKDVYTSTIILFRSGYIGKQIEKQLFKRNIKYKFINNTSFYERSEISDCLAYLKVICSKNFDHIIALRRIINTPKRQLGDKVQSLFFDNNELLVNLTEKLYSKSQYNKLYNFALILDKCKNIFYSHTDNKLGFILQFIIDEINYFDYINKNNQNDEDKIQEKCDNVKYLILTMNNYGCCSIETCVDFLEDIMLANEINQSSSNDKYQVLLSTIHSSKGGEWDNVIISGVEENILPSNKADTDINEEKRLLYVGMSRAKQNLTLTHCSNRYMYNYKMNCEPSRFLQDLHTIH